MKTISPLLLAAGQSTRFGSDKLLHPVSHKDAVKPLILHSIAPWIDTFSMLNVIIRPDNDELIQLLQNSEFSRQLNLINSIHAERGMSASLVTGVVASQHADAWLIGLADMPFLNKTVIADSMSALQTGAAMTQPAFAGRRGHPVGFSSEFLPQLLALEGDKGARDILAASADRISVIPSEDAGIYLDIDTKQDAVSEHL